MVAFNATIGYKKIATDAKKSVDQSNRLICSAKLKDFSPSLALILSCLDHLCTLKIISDGDRIV